MSLNCHLCISEVIDRFTQIEKERGLRSRERKRRDLWILRHSIEVLVCDLAHHHLSGHTKGIAISRANIDLKKKSRYKNSYITGQLPYIMDVLELPELQIVEQLKGGLNLFDTEHKGHFKTVMRSGRHLIHLLQKYQIEYEDMGLGDCDEMIILKSDKKGFWDKSEIIEYEDNDLTYIYRKEMKEINQWINEADLNYLMPVNSNTDVDLSERRLRRYFTRGSFESGGRLFGGFWQELKKEQRKNIIIDDEEAVSLDYSQMGPRILYGVCRTRPTTEDCYRIPNYERYRNGIKKVFNAMTFTEKPMTRYPKGVKQMFKEDIRFQEVSEAIRRYHSGIAHKFYVGIGHYLQYLESQILIKVLFRLKELGIHALPIHDAVVVGKAWVDMSRQLMEQVFLDMTNVESWVQVE